MKKHIVLAMVTATALVCTVTLSRPVQHYSYERLFAEADLVVFATAQKTEETADQLAGYGNFSSDKVSYKYVGQNSTFKVKYSLKGEAQVEQIKILHFKYVGTEGIVGNAPALVAFRTEPVTVTAGNVQTKLPIPEYLLFLRRMKDGRYEAVSGQTDPVLSVREVSVSTH